MGQMDIVDVGARIRVTTAKADTPPGHFAIRRWVPSLPRLVVAYPAFFVLKDDEDDRVIARQLWKRKAR